MKVLTIVTGPPGSGKSTYSQRTYPEAPHFDRDLGNKDEWRREERDCVLLTSAPSVANKDYWINEARLHGFTPIVLVMWVPRMVAYGRMVKRDGKSPTQRNDLQRSVERWYKKYGRHRQETRIPN